MQNLILIALDKGNNKAAPSQYESVRHLLNSMGILFTETIGGYKHDNGLVVTEPTFAIYWLNETAYKTAKAIAQQFNQESILLVDSDSRSYLRYLDTNTEKYIGMFTAVDKVSEGQGFTQLDNKTWVCK